MVDVLGICKNNKGDINEQKEQCKSSVACAKNRRRSSESCTWKIKTHFRLNTF